MKILLSITIRKLIIISFLLRLSAGVFYYFLFHPFELQPIINENYQGLGTDGHLQIARTLWLSGEYAFEVGGSPVHSRPPLHPILMMITSAWSEKYWFFLWFIVASLLGTLSVYLVYKISQKFQFAHYQSILIASIVTFHPYLIIIARSTTFVHLGTVLLLYSFYWYWHAKENNKKYIFLGFLSGLSLLTHATFQILPFTICILLILNKKILQSILVVTFCILTVTPWSIRNFLTFQKPIFLVTGKGMQYWKGEESAFRNKVDIYRKVYEEHTGKPLKIAYFCTLYPDDDDLLWELGMKNIQQNPLQTLQRFLYGIVIFLFPHETGWLKFLFTFSVNLPIYLLIFRNIYKKRLISWQKEILLYFLLVTTAFAFFTPHAGYIVMFLPLICLLII